MSSECKLEFEDFDDFDELDELDGIDWNNSELQIIEPKSSNLNCNTFKDNRPTNSYTPAKQHLIGFDEECGKTWHYPIDFPLRDYQFSIVRKCLFTNTLVCLPTGLGKTFIAAVVMLNFYRWYPQGKIVFLAPTKPLVNQQINACCNITALPRYEVAELTGATSSQKRVKIWRDNRVFFLTPQVMQNDLSSGICPAKEIVCCVLDEAHKALGNYAYTQVVRELLVNSVKFRVLALSATPGDDLAAIQEVINNLLINCIELRTEESIDVIPYTHHRKVEKYVVKLEGTLGEIHSKFLNVLSGIVKKLYSQKAVYTDDPKRLCRYQLIKAREHFRSTVSGAFIGPVEGEFAVGISLYHSYEQLYSSGIRACYQSIKRLLSDGKSSSRLHSEVVRNVELNQLMSKMEKLVDSMHKFFIRTNSMDPNLSIVSFGDTSFDLTSTLASDDFFYSHPKLLKLEEIVVSHFRLASTENTTNSTRVMIFSSFRDSVEEISVMLHRHTPLVRVMCFYGHGNKPTGTKGQKGFTQKEQLKVMERFREGGYNVLVSTCVGEEGLDIGDVDLIVCFDSPKAPTRYVQRMGRTGRKREGRIVMLLSEGKEEQAYQKCQTSKKHIYKIITEGHKHLNFYTDSPKMVPTHISPQPNKLYLQQQQEEEKIPPAIFSRGIRTTKKGKQSKTIVNFPGFSSAASEFNKNRDQVSLSKEELNRWTVKYCLSQKDTLSIQQRLATYTGQREMLSLMDEQQRKEISSIPVDNTEAIDCSKWLDWQSSIQTGTISHSTVSNSLIDCIKTIHCLKNSDTAADEYEAALQIDRTGSYEDQSIHTGLTQLTLRTNINQIPSKSRLPRNKKKHTKIDNSNSDSDLEYSITPTTTNNIINFPDKSDDIGMKHPFASATVRQKIFTLESSSDEIYSDDSQGQKSRNYSSPPPAQCEYSVDSVEDLLNTPCNTRNKLILPLSSQESVDQSIPSSLNKPHTMDEESVELVFVDNKTSDNETPIDTSFDIHGSPKHTHTSPSQYDSPINVPGISMLSKTSTPNKTSNFIDSDVICIDKSNENPKNCVTISPMLNPITSSSFFEDIPGPVNGNINRVRRKAKTPNFESSDSENEALKSLCRKRKFQSKRQIISSQFSPAAPVVNNPKKKRKLNYFIDHEAIESDGEYSQESFQSPPTTSTSNADTNTEEFSAISRLIADTSGSTTGINESSMYARYVHDLISPPANPACKLVIDPKRHRTLAAAGKNILKFKERQFDSIITDSSGDIEAEEVYGVIDEEEEERLYYESITNKKSDAETIFTPPKPVKQVKATNSVILIEDSAELLLAGSVGNKEQDEVSFSLGMDEWLGDLEVFDSIEEPKQLIVEKENCSKVIVSTENPTFSLGMDDWWEDIDPKDLDTDFLTNNPPTIPPTEPLNIPSTPSLAPTTTTSTPLLSTPKELTLPTTQLLPTSPSPIRLTRKSNAIQIESFSSTFNSPLYSNNKTTQSNVMTSSLNDSDSPIIIFADTREVSGSQILSSLRIKHNINIQVYSLKQCSYVVSSRMAVDRQNFSDLSQQNSTQRIIDRARSMCELYDRGSIIIEKDRVKAKLQGAKKSCVLSRNQLFITNLARLFKSRLSVLFSGSEQNTIEILVSLSKQEAKRGHKIIGSLPQIDTPLFKFLCCMPKINPTVALGLATYLRNLDQLSSITPDELKKNCHGITKEQIDSIQKIFAHRFRSFALVQ